MFGYAIASGIQNTQVPSIILLNFMHCIGAVSHCCAWWIGFDIIKSADTNVLAGIVNVWYKVVQVFVKNLSWSCCK